MVMTELASDEFEEISYISPSGDVLIRVYTPKQCTDPVDWGEFEEIERPAMLVRPGMFDMEVVTLTNPDGRWRRRIGTVRPTMNAAPSAASESAPLSDTNSPFVKHSLQTDGQSEVQYADGWEILYHDGSGVRFSLYADGFTGDLSDYEFALPYWIRDAEERIVHGACNFEQLSTLGATWAFRPLVLLAGKKARAEAVQPQADVEQTYHDNKVHFRSKYGQPFGTANEIVYGSYEITSAKVSSGQDPDNYIDPPFTRSFSSNGTMSFKVGRHGTDAVANWFSSYISDSENTFGHAPDKLNFGFKGTLKLTVTGGSFSGMDQTLVFKDVFIAQGHTGTSNNWWFGAIGARNPDDGKRWVRVEGKAPTPYGEFDASMYFQRGGEPLTDDEIFVYEGSLNALPTEAWMTRLIGTTRVQDMVLPGSHNAGMYGPLHNCTGGGFGEAASRAQRASIAEQLRMGVRYLDIRVARADGQLLCYHRTGTGTGPGCDGATLDEVLTSVDTFLTENRGEFVILSFTHIPDADVSAIQTMINRHANRLHKVSAEPGERKPVNQFILEDLRGKMLVVSEGLMDAPDSGFYRKTKGPNSWDAYQIVDDYANSKDTDAVIEDQLGKWARHVPGEYGVGFMLNWTRTPQSGADSVEKMAKVINEKLAHNLNSYPANWSAPQVVLLDFVTPGYVNSIVNQNLANISRRDEGDEVEPPVGARVNVNMYPLPLFDGDPVRKKLPFGSLIPLWRETAISNEGGSVRFAARPYNRNRLITFGGLGLLCFRQYIISKDFEGDGFEVPLLSDVPTSLPKGVREIRWIGTNAKIRWLHLLQYGKVEAE
ncbi:phospholipase [Pseudomonas putida]|nr:phospholipase [Pseudomonas putida]